MIAAAVAASLNDGALPLRRRTRVERDGDEQPGDRRRQNGSGQDEPDQSASPIWTVVGMVVETFTALLLSDRSSLRVCLQWLDTAVFATGATPQRTPNFPLWLSVVVIPDSRQYGWVITARTAPLLEREDQLGLVDQLLAEARDGRGMLMLFEGAPGIGKSRLLGAACDAAETLEFQVLRARGGELERDFSYGVVRQFFETRLTVCGDDERARLLAGAAHLASPLFEFGETSDGLARGEDASQTTLHGLFWLTANLAEFGPLYCSPSTTSTGAIRPRCGSSPTSHADSKGFQSQSAACVRTGEPGVDAAALDAFGSEPLATVVRPAPLSPEAVAQLLRDRLASDPAEEFVQAVHSSCMGNPFLLNELVHAVLEGQIEPTASAAGRVRELGPESLSRFVLRRLRRLGPDADALARAVAILGEERDLELAAALAGLDPEAAAASAAELARSDVFRPRGPLAFAHPILRTAVYVDLTDAERERGHEAAAELLGDTGAPAQRVAAHLLNVTPRARASVVATLREAARRASDEGAADVARSYLERALVEPPDAHQRADVVFELGSAELRSGLPGALGHLREAHELVRGQPPSAEVALALANAYFAEDVDLFEAADGLQRTIEGLDPRDAALTQRLEAELVMWARFDARLYPMARERLARIADRATEDSLGGRLPDGAGCVGARPCRRIARPGAGSRTARALWRPPFRWRELSGLHGGRRGPHELGRVRHSCAPVHRVARTRPQTGLGLRVRPCFVVPRLCAPSPR